MHLVPPAWTTEPLVTFTYHLQPGARDPWGKPVPDPSVVDARAFALADAAPGDSVFRRVDGSLGDAVRAAAQLAALGSGAVYEAHAVLQAADGACYITRLHSVSYGGRMEGAPSIDGRMLPAVVRSIDVTSRTPELRAIVGGAGWIPVVDGAAGAYQTY